MKKYDETDTFIVGTSADVTFDGTKRATDYS